jgi:hypothetical protein
MNSPRTAEMQGYRRLRLLHSLQGNCRRRKSKVRETGPATSAAWRLRTAWSKALRSNRQDTGSLVFLHERRGTLDVSMLAILPQVPQTPRGEVSRTGRFSFLLLALGKSVSVDDSDFSPKVPRSRLGRPSRSFGAQTTGICN